MGVLMAGADELYPPWLDGTGRSSGPFVLDVDRYSPENRRRLSGPGVRTFTAIADVWQLNETQRRLILGLPSRSTFQNWVSKAKAHCDLTLDVDTLTRLSAVLGIYAALGILFSTQEEQVAWLKGTHRARPFKGSAPLALVAGGTLAGLLAARDFLDAAVFGAAIAPNEVDKDFRPYIDSDIVFS
ncbi:antitoxin Xre-like helix-turn-helix domain-containing protein [Lichenicoccus roseus]|nr:antitoxin Xre-like helix-turn-helix domain-containing protein [Lichenicoccus roseus]